MLITQKQSLNPHFLLLENNQHATIKLCATLQKILGSGLRATLIFQNVKVAVNPLPIFLLKFAESFIVPCWLFSNNKEWGSAASVLIYEHNKAKINGVFHWISHCHGNLLRQDDKQILRSNNYSFK